MTNLYVSSVAFAAVTQWAASTAVSLGAYRRQLAAQSQGNDRVFKCTTAGTTGGSEPAWNRNNNATTSDGSVVWTCVSGQEANQSAGNWTAPCRDIACLFNQHTVQTTDFIYVSSDHDRVYTSDPSLNAGGQFISVSRTGGSLPPVEADWTAGATEETSNGVGYQFSLSGYAWGLTIKVGSGGASTANIQLRSRGNTYEWENCTFDLNNTATASNVLMQQGETFAGRGRLRDCTIKLGNASQSFGCGAGMNEIFNLTLTGTAPTAGFFNINLNDGAQAEIRDCDFSGVTQLFASGSNTYFFGRADFINCKVQSGGPNPRNTQNCDTKQVLRFWNCDDGSNINYAYFEVRREGRIQSVGNAVRSGGATIDGSVPYSLKMRADIAAGGATWQQPQESPKIITYLDSAGVSKTATIEIASVQALTDSDTWMELEACLNSTDTKGSTLSTRAAKLATAGTALTTSSAAWDSAATARANSHAYAVGDVLKVASNSGRLFYCTAAGTSASSEPGGYATAVDGSSITDGGATFKALRRYKLQKTFTPGRIGDVRACVKTRVWSGTANTEAIFVDPLLDVA